MGFYIWDLFLMNRGWNFYKYPLWVWRRDRGAKPHPEKVHSRTCIALLNSHFCVIFWDLPDTKKNVAKSIPSNLNWKWPGRAGPRVLKMLIIENALASRVQLFHHQALLILISNFILDSGIILKLFRHFAWWSFFDLF